MTNMNESYKMKYHPTTDRKEIVDPNRGKKGFNLHSRAHEQGFHSIQTIHHLFPTPSALALPAITY